MNILIAINEKYIEPAKTMLYSLARHNNEYLDVYLLQSSISSEKIKELDKFLHEKCHGELNTITIDKTLFANVPKQKWLSEETYYRLVAFELLPETVERILWLDGDIIVKGNIFELYNQEFDSQYIIACAENTTKHHKRLGLSNQHRYFNAGVVLYNMVTIRQHYTIQDVFECIEKHKDHLDLLDQDILNVLFDSKTKYMEAKTYNNATLGFNILGREKMKDIRENACIIHYIGAMKPWNPKGANWADKYWWRYELRRGGRWKAFAYYNVQHFPVKLYHYVRELYYFIKGQLRKLI